MVHPWVNAATRRIDYSLSRPWRDGSSLAGLVMDVLDALQANAKAPAGHAAAVASSASARPHPVAGLMRSSSLDGGDACVAALRSMTSAQLADCLTEPATHFVPVCAAAAACSEAAAVVASLRASNVEAAQLNCSLAQEAADIRSQSAIVRSTDFAPAKARYDAAAQAQADLIARCSVPVLAKQLADAAAQDEVDSEACEAAFVGGQLPVEQFVRQHKALRVRYHTRMLKKAGAVGA